MEWLIIVLVIGVGIGLWILPFIIVSRRKCKNGGLICVINILGLFLPFLWLIALIWSLIGAREQKQSQS